MKYKSIMYQRVVNLGSYESERMQVEAELEDGDDEYQVARQMQQFVHLALGLDMRSHFMESAEVETAQKDINF